MFVCVFVNRTRGVCVRQERNAQRGKRKYRNYLYVEIALTPGGRSDAESDFHSVGSAEGVLLFSQKNQNQSFRIYLGRASARACTPIKGFARRLNVF